MPVEIHVSWLISTRGLNEELRRVGKFKEGDWIYWQQRSEKKSKLKKNLNILFKITYMYFRIYVSNVNVNIITFC